MRATFSIDQQTHDALERLAEAEATSKSEIVREAVAAYEVRRRRLTERERQAKLEILRQIRAIPQSGTEEELEAELEEVRRARRESARPDL